MCTAIKVDFKDGFFGRNMDIDHSFGEQIIITPRNYRLKFKVSNSFERHYAIMGVGTVIDEYPLYADAMNEKELCFAGLSFKDNAKYYPIDLKKDNYTPYELPLYILGTCDDIKMVKERLKLINLIDIPFKSEIPLTSLHFMFSDKNESIVLESTVEGIRIYDNPYHVLTNNPPFIYHLYNLNNYQGLHNGFIDNKFKYDSIKNIFNCEFFENELSLLDMRFNTIEYKDQIIGVFLDIDDIGKVLIPEIKPTKDESQYLVDNYHDIDYIYINNDNIKIDLKEINSKYIISNEISDKTHISLKEIETFVLNKNREVVYEIWRIEK